MPTISKVSLSGPAELLTVLPFHLGFRPTHSVVVACLHGPRLGLVARLDVPEPADAHRAAAQTVPTLVDQRPTSVLLVGFADGPDTPADPRPLLDALRDGLEDAGVPVGERLVVRNGRWFGLDCGCCPPPGRPLPEAADVPAVAEYVATGRAVLGSRDALARLVEPVSPDDPRHEPRLVAVEEWAQRRARGLLLDESLEAWVRLVRYGLDAEPSPRTVAALVGPLVDTQVRDLLVSWLCRGFPGDHVPGELSARLGRALESVDGPETDADTEPEPELETELEPERLVLARLEQLCRAAPEACAAPVLGVTAAYAWWTGDGARGSVAADRALLVDPEHGLALLVREALGRGMRPPRCA